MTAPHTNATNADIIAALAETLRESHAAARPGVFRIIVGKLREVYGTKLVDRALHAYERAMGQERRRLRQENRALKRQVRQAKADWMKRQ